MQAYTELPPPIIYLPSFELSRCWCESIDRSNYHYSTHPLDAVTHACMRIYYIQREPLSARGRNSQNAPLRSSGLCSTMFTCACICRQPMMHEDCSRVILLSFS
uniref:Uncharacterized protein n=1 Tax=Trichogramma kaykai TaxID=54128 RepID=A0ABD2VTA2_9HYME